MNIIRKHICYISILAAIMLISLCGCAQSRPVVDEEYIEAELQERYGMEFVCDSLKYSQHMYEAICHPVNDPSLSFDCMYGEDGSLGYDFYVGAIIAKEESACFSDNIGNELGESFSQCAYAIIIDKGVSGYTEGNLNICELIKNNTFSIQKVYEICPIDSLFFRIFINERYCNDDYGNEYDVIKNAVDMMVLKYRELYGLDIYIDMDIWFLDDLDYKQLVDGYDDINADFEEIFDRSELISLQMGIQKDFVTKDLWLSREEYISVREGTN